jgi:hypothetical protein
MTNSTHEQQLSIADGKPAREKLLAFGAPVCAGRIHRIATYSRQSKRYLAPGID